MSTEKELPRTVYLFGAGASAGAIPINTGENNIFNEIEKNILNNYQRKESKSTLEEELRA